MHWSTTSLAVTAVSLLSACTVRQAAHASNTIIFVDCSHFGSWGQHCVIPQVPRSKATCIHHVHKCFVCSVQQLCDVLQLRHGISIMFKQCFSLAGHRAVGLCYSAAIQLQLHFFFASLKADKQLGSCSVVQTI
jgi:hypothetical protein